jgi:hypothetical protein
MEFAYFLQKKLFTWYFYIMSITYVDFVVIWYISTHFGTLWYVWYTYGTKKVSQPRTRNVFCRFPVLQSGILLVGTPILHIRRISGLEI